MKTLSIFPSVALLAITLTACDRRSPESELRIAQLEQSNLAAAERQRELERQIDEQTLAVEREAIERERALIEEERAELEYQAEEEVAAQEEALRLREEEIAEREERLEEDQVSLAEQEQDLEVRGEELSERDREIAGREALPFEAEAEGDPVGDYGTFHESLSSYGSWFETPDYGYVWQPAVVREANWRPYSRGRWICSDRGWTWVSDEPFGWATYHYGRWALLNGRGWIWVPGSEWAPSWVSWRENDSHIGWAPLPPETLGWRGYNWDSSVDVRFGIGAACFNFVAIRNFGSPIYRHCLPVSGNQGWYGNTVNITYIHVKNRQVICGGPRYQHINERIGRPIPFHRLEMDRQPRLGRGHLATRPEIRGGRLRVAAPNLDAEWNAGLRPGKIRGKIEQVDVVRGAALDKGVTDRFRRSLVEDRERADEAIAGLGGRERFEERRAEMLMTKRKLLETPRTKGTMGDSAGKSVQPEREIARVTEKPKKQESAQVTARRPTNSLPDGVTRGLDSKPAPAGLLPGSGSRAEFPDRKAAETQVSQKPAPRNARSAGATTPLAPPPPVRLERKVEDRMQQETRVESNRKSQEVVRNNDGKLGQRDLELQTRHRQADQARKAQEDSNRRKLDDQARQQQEKQRLDNQAREARNQQMEQSRKQQVAQEEARRQQQQREAQRQQELALQRQQESARQQEQDRQRQQEQQQQQRQMEQSRQRQEEQEQQGRQREQERQQEQDRQRQQEQAQQQRQQEERGRQQRQEENSGKRNK